MDEEEHDIHFWTKFLNNFFKSPMKSWENVFQSEDLLERGKR